MVDKNPGFYKLISNVARRFLHILGEHEDADPLFLEREKYVAEAAKQELSQVPEEVFDTWDMSVVGGSHKGLVKVLIPVMTCLFHLPGMKTGVLLDLKAGVCIF